MIHFQSRVFSVCRWNTESFVTRTVKSGDTTSPRCRWALFHQSPDKMLQFLSTCMQLAHNYWPQKFLQDLRLEFPKKNKFPNVCPSQTGKFVASRQLTKLPEIFHRWLSREPTWWKLLVWGGMSGICIQQLWINYLTFGSSCCHCLLWVTKTLVDWISCVGLCNLVVKMVPCYRL